MDFPQEIKMDEQKCSVRTAARAQKFRRWAKKTTMMSGCSSCSGTNIYSSARVSARWQCLHKRQGFNVHSQIAYNGLSFSMTTLVNTEANDFLFIDIQQAVEIAKFFKIPITQLKTTAGTKEFNRQSETSITHAIMLHLVIDEW